MYMACCVKPPETYQSWQHSRDLHHTLYNILFSFYFYFSLPIIIIIISPRFCCTFESASNVSFLLSHPPCIFAPPSPIFLEQIFPIEVQRRAGNIIIISGGQQISYSVYKPHRERLYRLLVYRDIHICMAPASYRL